MPSVRVTVHEAKQLNAEGDACFVEAYIEPPGESSVVRSSSVADCANPTFREAEFSFSIGARDIGVGELVLTVRSTRGRFDSSSVLVGTAGIPLAQIQDSPYDRKPVRIRKPDGTKAVLRVTATVSARDDVVAVAEAVEDLPPGTRTFRCGTSATAAFEISHLGHTECRGALIEDRQTKAHAHAHARPSTLPPPPTRAHTHTRPHARTKSTATHPILSQSPTT